MLAVHTDLGTHARSLSAQLPAAVGSARVARKLVESLLDDSDLDPDLIHDAELVAHELVANAVLHGDADPSDTVRCACVLEDDAVVVVVHDDGLAGQVEIQPWDVDRPTGRGLVMVAGLSESWSVDRSHGTTVTARLAVRRAA